MIRKKAIGAQALAILSATLLSCNEFGHYVSRPILESLFRHKISRTADFM